MAKKKCTVRIINGQKRKAVTKTGGLSPEIKKAADAFYERNKNVLKNAALALSSKKNA